MVVLFKLIAWVGASSAATIIKAVFAHRPLQPTLAMQMVNAVKNRLGVWAVAGLSAATFACMVTPAFAGGGDSVLLVPEFYFHIPKQIADTTFEMKCYDRQNQLLDNWKSFDEVRFVSVFRNYTDHKHTYKDKEGKTQELPVSSIITRYDKMGTQTWMMVAYATQAFTKLKEDKNTIVRVDTLPLPGAKSASIFVKYYKVAP